MQNFLICANGNSFSLKAVALSVSRARGQSQFGRPPQPVHGQHRCEEWVGSEGASKADMIVTSQNGRQELTALEIVDYRIVRNLIVSHKAIHPRFEISVTIEHSNCCIATFRIAVMQCIRTVTASEWICKNQAKSFVIICKCLPEFCDNFLGTKMW